MCVCVYFFLSLVGSAAFSVSRFKRNNGQFIDQIGHIPTNAKRHPVLLYKTWPLEETGLAVGQTTTVSVTFEKYTVRGCIRCINSKYFMQSPVS